MDPALVPALYDALIVARLGSVGAAARKLGKTPSAVSQQIRHLSDRLGIALFEKQGRGVRLTPDGERLLPLTTRLFDETEAFFRMVGELGGSSATTLRIAASDYLGRPLLVPVLRALAAEGVPLHFEVTTAHSEEALARLEHGEVELAIVSFSGERAGLEARALFRQSFYWIAPKRDGACGPLVERLAEEPLLRLGAGSVGRRLLDDWLDERGIRPRSTVDLPSVALVIDYAVGGVGVGLVPSLPLVEAVAGSGRGAPHELATVEVERAELPELPVMLVSRAGRKHAQAVERFIERLEVEAADQARRLARLEARRGLSPAGLSRGVRRR